MHTHGIERTYLGTQTHSKCYEIVKFQCQLVFCKIQMLLFTRPVFINMISKCHEVQFRGNGIWENGLTKLINSSI